MDNFLLAADRLRILGLEQMRFLFLLVVVLDESPSSINHFIESVGETFLHLVEVDLASESCTTTATGL